MLRNNGSIKGINLNNNENLLVQFADDTTICLDGSEQTFREAINTITRFARMSGLKINKQKTQCIFIGSLKNSNIRYMRDENFVWNPGTWKILGIWFSTDTHTIVAKNYENKLYEIRNILSKWKQRKLTPYGKITIIKTLAISKIIHLLINLPDPKKQFLDELDNELIRFLWDYKPNRIKKCIVNQEYEKGGLKMCNVKNMLSTLKVSVFKKLSTNEVFNRFTLNLYPELEQIDNFGAEYCKKIALDFDNPFWADVMKHINTLHEHCISENIEELLAEPIFFNNSIVRDHKYIYDRQWANNGVLFVHQLLNNEVFLTFDQFCNKYSNINTNFLQFHGIVRAIKRYIRSKNFNLEAFKGSKHKVSFALGKGNKYICKILNESDLQPAAVIKWNSIFQNLQWNKIFQGIYITTGDVQLRWFQFRLVHRLLPTQRYLYLRKIVADPVCNFCDSEEQTICHLFFECDHIRKFWNELVMDFKRKCNHCRNLDLSIEFILFGHTSTFHSDRIFSMIILLAKFFIYKNKLNNTIPAYNHFILYLKNRYQIENYLAKVKNSVDRFHIDWFVYKSIIE